MKFFTNSLLLISIFILSSSLTTAQSISIPDTLSGWDKSWTASANGSQAAYDNWSQGGVSSISGTASSVFTLLHRDGQFSYGFRTSLKYGQSNIRDGGVRKTDDQISIRNRFNYLFRKDGSISTYATIHFRTQFDKGYEYSDQAGKPNILISRFMAPAYLSEGLGLSFSTSSTFSLEAGLGLKQTFVTDDNLASVYGLERGENFRSEGGLTTGINFEKEVFEDILYSSSLETFTNLLIPVDETDVFWSNEIVGKINSIVSASFQFELRYDNDYSSELQVKQVLSAGVSVSIY
ncbi:DUF3078 domain-containing protein [Gracilimonas sp.]|uniref:DUF3078 domain-containing protein n=1 Tax=Gracilimonas sp. TaxID=1974203 RepID=UPI0028717452|nr:DUF3078 domain-containing protein [Gracilimonas sp.]